MSRWFLTYQIQDLFGGRMKWLLLLTASLTWVLSFIQYSPTWELGAPYRNMANQLRGPFTSETDALVASWNSLYEELSNTAYGEMEKQWVENVTGDAEQRSTPIDPKTWENSQKVLQGEGIFGDTVYDDLLLISKAVSRYKTLRDLPQHWENLTAIYERNTQRTSDSDMASYWSNLAAKTYVFPVVEFYNMDGIECFLAAFSNDWLLLLFLLICVTLLFSKDYKNEQYLLLSSTSRWGRWYLGKKVETLILLASLLAAISLLIQGTLLAVSLQHIQALLQPIQAVAGLENLLYRVPVWAFLMALWGFKWLVYMLVAAIAALVALLCKKLTLSLVCLGSLLGGHILCAFGLSRVTGLSPVHLLNLFSREGTIRMGEFLPVAGIPVPMGLCVAVAAALFVLIIFTMILWQGPKITRFVYQRL